MASRNALVLYCELGVPAADRVVNCRTAAARRLASKTETNETSAAGNDTHYFAQKAPRSHSPDFVHRRLSEQVSEAVSRRELCGASRTSKLQLKLRYYLVVHDLLRPILQSAKCAVNAR